MDRYEMNPDRLPSLLEQRGWLDYGDRRAESVHRALMEFQRWWGLVQDGWAGPATERVLEAPRFCGLPDRLNLGGRKCRWPMLELRWAITGRLPNISDSDLKSAYAEAWEYWAEVCGVRPEYSPSSKGANVVMGSGAIDGPSGTLAWSELPCGNAKQLEQRYDTREPWRIFDGSQSGYIDLVRVACHEIGHVIGIDHLSDGALMAPTYDRHIRKPQKADIREAQERYGEPSRSPPPVSAELPGEIVFSVVGNVGDAYYQGEAKLKRRAG